MITLQSYSKTVFLYKTSFIVLWCKFWKRLVTYGGLSDFIIKSFSETHVLSRSLTMDPSVKTEPWLDRRDSASSSALRLSAWALASHSSTFTVEKKSIVLCQCQKKTKETILLKRQNIYQVLWNSAFYHFKMSNY